MRPAAHAWVYRFHIRGVKATAPTYIRLNVHFQSCLDNIFMVYHALVRLGAPLAFVGLVRCVRVYLPVLGSLAGGPERVDD